MWMFCRCYPCQKYMHSGAALCSFCCCSATEEAAKGPWAYNVCCRKCSCLSNLLFISDVQRIRDNVCKCGTWSVWVTPSCSSFTVTVRLWAAFMTRFSLNFVSSNVGKRPALDRYLSCGFVPLSSWLIALCNAMMIVIITSSQTIDWARERKWADVKIIPQGRLNIICK